MAAVLEIVAIEKTPKRGKRRLIHFSEGDPVVLSLDLILQHNLEIGSEIDRVKLSGLIETDQKIQAKTVALALLTRKSLSESQLRVSLREKAYPDQIIDALLDDFRKWGYIDDMALLKSLIRQMSNAKLFGPARMRQELRRRGIDRDMIESELTSGTQDLAQRSFDALQRKSASYRRLDPTTARRRMHGYLARRGFDTATILSAIDRTFEYWENP